MVPEEIPFRTKVLRGFFWLSSGTFIGQSLSWIATIFVMRLLSPSDYGIMAMAGTVITLLATVGELGICSSVIQAAEINEEKIRQIFGFGIITSLLAGMICCLTAPVIAHFYNEQKLVPLVRLLSVDFILIIFYMIPESLYIREMNFKTKAIVDISAQVGAAILTLILALSGLGIWALVVGQLAPHAIKVVSYNLVSSSWIKPIFNVKGVESYVKFGLQVTGSRLIYYLFSVSDAVIVGKFMGSYLMGIYSVALNLASIPVDKVIPIINQVTFTSYARIQDDNERIKRNVLRAARMVAFISFPLFLGMAGVAKGALPMLLGSKWASIVVPFQLLCITLPLKALNPIYNSAVFAVGQAKINVINNIIIFIVMVVAFLIGAQNGIVGICLAWVIAYPAVFLITTILCLKVLKISLRDYLSEFIFPCSSSVVMLLSILLVARTIETMQPVLSLAILIIVGISVYLSLALIFRKDDYLELKKLLKR